MSELFSASFSICLKESSNLLYLNYIHQTVSIPSAGVQTTQKNNYLIRFVLLSKLAFDPLKQLIHVQELEGSLIYSHKHKPQALQTQAGVKQSPQSGKEIKAGGSVVTLCKVHFMVYALPEGGVYEKLLSPRRSSKRQVLMRAFTGSPRSAAS